MEAAEYARLEATEDGMWWFAALHARMLDAVARHPGPPDLPLLDAGCGTGGLLRRLAAAFPARPLLGVDIAPAAATAARRRSPVPVAVASVTALPFAAGSLGGVLMADVLCHRLVDEEKALAEAARVLAPGGTLVLNLPAFAWLLSTHDIRVHNVRRYDRRRAGELLVRAGFEIRELRFWNSLLFPLMVLQRKVLARGEAAESDVAPVTAPLDRLLRGVVGIERLLAGLGVRFPFGGSILAVAVKR
ncbi:class I SAM-dependent methyltransferase [Benzoatithermus flavus]|uniref:Class I SAM-dependent methyltransferase n=1 Tax=Benzoatithermus flavus TaxID=3108223 RepID=A0ABU8XL28_9PROT